MIVVDSSVWIDYFNGALTTETDWLHESIGRVPILLGDLILTEVLQGFLVNKEFQTAKKHLLQFPVLQIGGKSISIQSANHYRYLRKKGITVRKTIDVLIGTFCIHNQYTLLHHDKDFDPMEKYLKLSVLHTK